MSLVGIIKWIPFLLIALSPFYLQVSSTDPPSWQTKGPITLDNFNTIFDVTPDPKGPGGCGRYLGKLPFYGTEVSLMAVNDALNMTKGASDQMGKEGVDSTDEGETIRQLLYLFFGFRFERSGEIIAKQYHDYLYVRDSIDEVVWFLSQKNPPPYQTNWYCNDDWLMYTKHAVGSDGKENMTAPLAAQVKNWKMKNGAYFPGLLWDTIRGTGYYAPLENDPDRRLCQSRRNGKYYVDGYVSSYDDPNRPFKKAWNLSLCPTTFSTAPVGLNGEPGTATRPASDPEWLSIYFRSISVTTTHELFHLTSKFVIIDQPEVLPPYNDWDYVRKMKVLPFDVSQMGWGQNPVNNTYGITMSGWLGLAMPNLAQKSAENYAAFVMCLRYRTLNCLRNFAISISKRESVPFTVPPQVSRRLRDRGSGFDEEDFDAALEASAMDEYDDRDSRFSS